ncbi:MAG: Major facilitator superfamily 1 [Blastococcus sp.]|nr:Major facilitator superfamily 1 [Blastococcus sp.]
MLARPGYRRLWTARTVSQAGDVLQFTTLALLIYQLTGSGLGVSGLVLAEIAPVLLLAPLAGPLVDRLPRVQVMLAADLVRLFLAAALAVWHEDVTVVYVLAFGLSAGSVFFNPAAGSLLPTLVRDDELVVANSGIWSAAVLIQVALAPAAGLLAVTAGFGWAFAANAASFGLSALLLAGLRSGEAPRPITTTSIWTQGREALGLLGRDRLLRALAVAQALAALSAGATSALLVVLAARQLHAAGAGYGFLLAAIAVGAFLGPLLLIRLGARARSPRLLFGAFGLRGLVDLVLATVTALPAAVAALAVYGLGTSTGNVTFSSLIQSHVPEQLRGRVFAAFDLIWQSMRLASLLLGAALADTLGIRAVFYAGAVLLLAAALIGVSVAGRRRPF